MKISKNNLCKFLFYFSYFLILLSEMLSEVKYIQNILGYIEYASVLFLITVFIIQRKNYTFKSFIFLIMLIFLGGITTYYSGNKEILKLILLIIAFKNIEFNQIVKVDAIIKITLIITVFLFYFAGLTNETLAYRDNVVRNSFGFSHPNKIGLYLMMFCLDLYYLYSNKNLIIPNIVSIICSLFIYFLIDSRTSILILILAFILFNINKITKNKIIKNKLCYIVNKNMFLITTVVTILITYMNDNGYDIAIKLNKLLSYRLTLNQYFLNNYEITLLGSIVNTNNIYILDNSYINILLRFGLIVWVGIYIMFYKSMKKMYKQKKYGLIIIFVLMFFYGFSESFLYKITANVFLLYFAKIYDD